MAYTKKIKAGLVNQDPADFVGHAGTLFYNPDDGSLYLSDGVTAGGIPLGQGGGGGFDGNYNHLTNKPNLNVYATTTYVDNSIANVTWANLSGAPNISNLLSLSNTVANISFANLSGAPNMANYATTIYVDNKVANVTWANLSGAPNIANYATVANLSSLSNTVANISYANLSGAPNIANYATNANLTSLSNVVANISYANLSGKPTIPSVLTDLNITDGSNGQVLTTYGNGHYHFTTAAVSTSLGGNDTEIQFNDSGSFGASSNLTYNKTSGQVHIATTTSSPITDGYTGALVVEGGIATKGNIHMLHGVVHNQLYVGNNAGLTSFVNPTLIIKDTGANYIQASVINSEGNASADWVAYGDNGDDSQAWSDFGFTGSTFNDPTYTITKPNDGYFFVEGSGGVGGNMILATGAQSGYGDIIFATGGFLDTNEVMRITHDTKALKFTSNAKISTNSHTWTFNSNGNLILPTNTSHINYANGTNILSGLGASGNPFDQDLNTSNNVTFNSVITSNVQASIGTDIIIAGADSTPIPKAIVFNGLTNGGSYLSIPGSNDFATLGTTWTIEFRIKATGASTGKLYRIIDQEAHNDGFVDCYISVTLGNGYLNVLCTQSNSQTFPEPTPGVWTHVAIVNDNTNNVKFYYDGVLQTVGSIGLGGPANLESNHLINIGKIGGSGDFQYFPGSLSAIRISKVVRYPSAFSIPTEIFVSDSDTLLLMNVLDGQEYTDSSSYSRTITPHNSISTETISGIGSGPSNVIVTANSYSWTFDTTGNLTLPAGGDILDSTGNSVLENNRPTDRIVNGDFNVHLQSDGSLIIPSGNGSSSNQGQIFSENESSFINMDVQFNTDITGGFRLGTGSNVPVDIMVHANDEGGIKQWRFGGDGSLTLPGNALLGDTFSDGGITFQSPANTYAELGSKDGNAYVWVADQDYYTGDRANSAVYISTDYANADHRWTFKPDGNLSIPGTIYPLLDNSYDLGRPDYKFRHIYTDNGSIYLGNIKLSNDNGNLSVQQVTNVGQNTESNVAVALKTDRLTSSDGAHEAVLGTDGELTLPTNIVGDSVIYSDTGNVELYTNHSGAPSVKIRAKGSGGDSEWLFKANGEMLFPDSTTQTTAYRNRPLHNLNIEGGSASTVFEIDMTYVDCGGSYLRGILDQDKYDGYDNGSTTTSFDKILDGGQS